MTNVLLHHTPSEGHRIFFVLIQCKVQSGSEASSRPKPSKKTSTSSDTVGFAVCGRIKPVFSPFYLAWQCVRAMEGRRLSLWEAITSPMVASTVPATDVLFCPSGSFPKLGNPNIDSNISWPLFLGPPKRYPRFWETPK